MPAFIVFEGVDGAGKTTLAKNLASDLGALFIATPPPPLNAELARRFADEQTSIKTRFLYYLLGDSLASDIIRDARKSKIVVCDRYIHSTIIGHQLFGFNVDIGLSQFTFEEPDANFFIFVSDDEERRRRIAERGKKTKYDTLIENVDFRKKYTNYFLERSDFFSLDTSGDTPEESLEKIKRELVRKLIISSS